MKMFDARLTRRSLLSLGLAFGTKLPAATGRLPDSEPDQTVRTASAMRMRDFQALAWVDVADGQPLITPPWYSPILADPTFVPPADSPDGRWQLFAHSALGIHRYSAADGQHWTHHGIVIWNAMRAYLLPTSKEWWIYYEEYPILGLARTALPHGPWESRISRRRSTDLFNWESPQAVMSAELPWHQNGLGRAVGNPCVVRVADSGNSAWALYYSGGLVRIEDCGFNEPSAIGRATSSNPGGPWNVQTHAVITPSTSDPDLNLSAGSIKVLRVSDGFVGFQNAITWIDGHSRSAIFLLLSNDGVQWTREKTPLLAPGSPSWRHSHIYACDVRFDSTTSTWWMFYNARNDWPMETGREAIGAMRAS